MLFHSRAVQNIRSADHGQLRLGNLLFHDLKRRQDEIAALPPESSSVAVEENPFASEAMLASIEFIKMTAAADHGNLLGRDSIILDEGLARPLAKGK